MLEKFVESHKEIIQARIDVFTQILTLLLRQTEIMDRYIDFIFLLRDELPELILSLLIQESKYEFPRKAIFEYGLIKDIIS